MKEEGEMTKHSADTTSTTKKFLAAGGLAFSLAGFGLFAGVGTAVADGTEACWGGIPPPGDTAAGAFDAASSAGTVGQTMPDPEEAGCEHSRLTIPSFPAESSFPGLPRSLDGADALRPG